MQRNRFNAKEVHHPDQHRRRHAHQHQPLHRRHAAFDRVLLSTEIHEVNDAQIVKRPDDRGHSPGNRQPHQPRIHCRFQHIELTEKAQHRRDTGKAEQQDQHRHGLQRLGPGELVQAADIGDRTAITLHRQDEGKGAKVHGDIDRHIDQRGLHPLRGGRSQTDQRIAHMGDGRIGHQALDVFLANRGHSAKEHRDHRQRSQNLAPIVGHAAKGVMHNAGDQRHGGHLGGGCEEGRDRGRRTIVNIGCPHVEGRGRDLERHTSDQEHKAEQQAQGRLAFGQGRGDAREERGASIAVDQ